MSKLSLCSRTQAFGYIEAGRVVVNGRVCRDAARRVSLEHDRISVDGALAKEVREPIVIALHKPVGYVTTRSDPQGRKTVYDLLPKLDRFIFPLGRLDQDTSGLLIFTDDHRLGERLMSPQSHVPKTYEVLVAGEVDARQISALRAGVSIGRGEQAKSAQVERGAAEASGAVLRVVIDEGKNRQIRRMIAAVGVSVVRLTRIAIGDFQLGSLPVGETRSLSVSDQRLLGRSLSTKPRGAA